MNKSLLSFLLVLIFSSATAQLERSELDTAILKAVNYLNQLPDSSISSYNQRLLFMFVSKNYRLPASPKKGLLQKKLIHAEDKPVKEFYGRIINPGIRSSQSSLTKEYRQAKGIQKAMLWGIYPDYLSLDSCKHVFESTEDIRGMAHLSLAMRWAESNKTNHQHQWLSPFYDIYETQFLKLSPEVGVTTDSGLEGLVGLVCLGRAEKIPLKWIKSVVNAQKQDGGWSFNGEPHEASNAHTTLLALWVLASMQPEF